MLSLAFGGFGVYSVGWHLFVEADPADFDPRPALARLVESGRLDALLVAVTNAKHDAHTAAARARHIPRDAAISLAALLALLFPATGGTR